MKKTKKFTLTFERDWYRDYDLREPPLTYEEWLSKYFKLELIDIVGSEAEPLFDDVYDDYLITLGAKDIS